MKGSIINIAKNICKAAMLAPPLNMLLQLMGSRSAVLMYHRIVPTSRPGCHPNRNLEIDLVSFHEQLSYISKHFNCVSLDELAQLLQSGKLKASVVAVTFDDGYLDNLELALPLLEKYRVPATVYITTAFIDATLVPWWYELEFLIEHMRKLQLKWDTHEFDLRLCDANDKISAFWRIESIIKTLPSKRREDLMAHIRHDSPETFNATGLMLDWQRLKTLSASPYITIGAHTLSHPNLAVCSNEELDHELIGSKRLLEEKLGVKISHLAYPYGTVRECGEREFTAAAQAGFTTAVTTTIGHLHRRHAQHLTALPRIPLSSGDLGTRLKWLLNGGSLLASGFFGNNRR